MFEKTLNGYRLLWVSSWLYQRSETPNIEQAKGWSSQLARSQKIEVRFFWVRFSHGTFYGLPACIVPMQWQNTRGRLGVNWGANGFTYWLGEGCGAQYPITSFKSIFTLQTDENLGGLPFQAKLIHHFNYFPQGFQPRVCKSLNDIGKAYI